MATKERAAPTLVEAVQSVFEALEPFDAAARQRILSSVVSLLGGSPQTLYSQAAAPAPLTSAIPSSTSSGERRLSPVELLQEKQPATNPQRIATFAFYREHTEGLSRFAKDDLKAYFPKARIPPPQNFDRDYRHAVSEGWIYDDGADSYLTSKGLEAVTAGFGGKATPRGPGVSRKKASKASASRGPRKGAKSRKRHT